MATISCSLIISLLFLECHIIRDVKAKLCPGLNPLKLTHDLTKELYDSVFWTVAYYKSSDSNGSSVCEGIYLGDKAVRIYMKLGAGSRIWNVQAYCYYPSMHKTFTHKFEFTTEGDDAIFKPTKAYYEWEIEPNGNQQPRYSEPVRLFNSVSTPFGLIHVGADGHVRIYQACDLDVMVMQISDEAMKNHTLGEPYNQNFTNEFVRILNQYNMDPRRIRYIQIGFPFNPHFRYYATTGERRLLTTARRNTVAPETYDPTYPM